MLNHKCLAIVICNWNNKDDVLKCIQSVMESKYQNFDLFVVDNASTDDSVKAIQTMFSNQLTLICNSNNGGSSRGFNTGISRVLEGSYEYVHLLDHDVILDDETLSTLYEYMETHPEVGAAGSKFCYLDDPKRVQFYDSSIDWKAFTLNTHYSGYMEDDERLPEVVAIDFCPAGSVMIRTQILREIGFFDENYFMYWDDVDLGYRMRNAGHQLIVYGKSKVLHKFGAISRKNTMTHYYFTRNRIRFFAKYLPDDEIDSFADSISQEMARMSYMSTFTGRINGTLTTLLAIDDALHDVVGRASQRAILSIEEFTTASEKLHVRMMSKETIYILDCESDSVVYRVTKLFADIITNQQLKVVSKQLPTHELKKTVELGVDIISYDEFCNRVGRNDLVCSTCPHVLDADSDTVNGGDICVDSFLHVVDTEEDRNYLSTFVHVEKMYRAINLPYVKLKLRDLREQME